MFDDKFCLVVGTFFQEKATLEGLTVFNTMFMGVLDFNLNVGAFQDCYGDSDIEVISVTKKDDAIKLVFLKTYEIQPNCSIHYELFSKQDPKNNLMEWVGTWSISSIMSDYGSVRMQTIFTDSNVVDYKITNKLLKQFIPEKDLPF